MDLAQATGQIFSSSDFANPTTLMNQASMTAETYLTKAVEVIDRAFEKGYAAAHPQLIAAFMQVAAADFATATIAKAIMYAGEQLAESEMDTLAEAVNGVADAISPRDTSVIVKKERRF
jgi:uncharacterized protein YjgD (DUF1641 family)